MLCDRGDWLTDLPLAERRTRLAELLDALPQERLLLSDQIIGSGNAYFNAIIQKGIEGGIAKRLDSPYLPRKRLARRWQYLGTVGAATEDKGPLYRELKDKQRLAAPNGGPTMVEWRDVQLLCAFY